MADYERVYFCFCADNCKFETMTKEQIINAIYEAVTTGEIKNIDAGFITKVKEQNKGNSLVFWLGTTAEYNAIETKDPNCFYIKTDEDALAGFDALIKTIQESINSLEIRANDFEKHAGNRKNPHYVTAAQVGAYPAIEDSADEGCFYRSELEFDGIYDPELEYEWINPPMYENCSYLTVERYATDPVYVSRVSFGAMPNNAAGSVSIGKNLTIVSIEGMARKGNYTIPLSVMNSINSIYYNSKDGKLYIETKADYTEWEAELIIKYTK